MTAWKVCGLHSANAELPSLVCPAQRPNRYCRYGCIYFILFYFIIFLGGAFSPLWLGNIAWTLLGKGTSDMFLLGVRNR